MADVPAERGGVLQALGDRLTFGFRTPSKVR